MIFVSEVTVLIRGRDGCDVAEGEMLVNDDDFPNTVADSGFDLLASDSADHEAGVVGKPKWPAACDELDAAGAEGPFADVSVLS